MVDSNIAFQNNLVALAQVDPKLEQSLRQIKTNDIYEVFLLENESLENIKIADKRDFTLVDKNYAQDVYTKLKKYEEFDNYHSLYFFGIGSGVFYKNLLKNPNHKKIYIFEPELELIYIVLNLIDFSAELLTKKIVVKLTQDVDFVSIKQLINENSLLYLKKYYFDIYSDYYDKYSVEAKRINNAILLVFKHALQDKGDSLEDTLIGYKNSTRRMLYMFEQPSLLSLTTAIKGRKNAVMVSTGPSLVKQLPLLKKYRDYFTILSVDASYPVLYNAGIKPDIVLAMERVPEVSKFFEDIPKEFQQDVIFMLATVCHDDAFNSIKKEALLLPYLRADSHNTTMQLNDWGYLGGGLCGANYLFNFAINVEFENFVFIGQDLAFSKDGYSHAKGHVFGVDGEKFDEKFDGYLTAYGGDGQVATQKYWRIFLNDFVVQISASKKYKQMKIYNATEGGARIDGAIEIPFGEYCKNILDTNVKKEAIVLKYPDKDDINKIRIKYISEQKENIKLAKSIKKQAKKTFELVEDFLRKIKDFDETMLVKVSEKEIDILLDRIYSVRHKYANPRFLNPFASLLMSYLSHLDFDIAAVKTMRENTPHTIKLKKINYIKVNYEWLFRLWGSLEKIIEIAEDSLSNPYERHL